jgi:Ca2+-transporting ATPase
LFKVPAHTLDSEILLEKLESSYDGLSQTEVNSRLATYGTNELPESQKINYFKVLFSQFTDLLVIILIIAGIISALIGILEDEPESLIDVIAIVLVILLNAFLGFYQEISAEKAINSLAKLSTSEVVVLREKQKQKIASKYLVPGDIVILEAGEMVPADIRVLKGYELRVNESSLTGESLPIRKRNIQLSERIPLGDRVNMLYKGTSIVNGSGTGLVASTGVQTEIGKIASSLIEIQSDDTPLQKRLDHLAKQITIGVVILSAFILIFGTLLLKDISFKELFILAIGLAVAAVPEGLPAVLTLTLALGVTKLANKNSLIRKLPAVEVLGSTTTICTDKTGTLTKNEMTTKTLWTMDHAFTFTGTGYMNNGDILDSKTGQIAQPNQENYRDLQLSLEICSLVNDASLTNVSAKEPFKIFGDPTEIALLVATTKAGANGLDYLDEILNNWDKKFIFPFDSERKRMSSVVQNKSTKTYKVVVKGALDLLINLCTSYFTIEGSKPITNEIKKQILDVSTGYSKNFAYRILGLAYKDVSSDVSDKLILSEDHEESESNLTFVGLICMIDPPRDQSASAIEEAHRAGINVIMITGDHKETAYAIGKSIGLIEKEGSNVITGLELDDMSDEQLNQSLVDTKIFARVNPSHKLRIVNILKNNNEVVAMTGDGVNDAPALKRADIGIAMGISGTDVAKESSEMILVDDNFSNIVGAIFEGRVIYDNMKKFIAFLLSANTGEILTVLFGLLLGIILGHPLIPILAIQLLYINLVTDTFPAIALGLDNPEEDIMLRKPRDPNEPLLDKNLISMIFTSGFVFAFGAMFCFLYAIDFGSSLTPEKINLAESMAFTALVIYQLFHAVNTSERGTIFKKQTFKNRALLGSIALGFLLQMIALYMPLVSHLLQTTPLTLNNWIVIMLTAIPVVLIEEIRKLFFYKKPVQTDSFTEL